MANLKPNKTICIAAIQIVSINGKIIENLTHAEPFISEAKNKGAQLILLPEFMPAGYQINDSIWDAAEPAQGITVHMNTITSGIFRNITGIISCA